MGFDIKAALDGIVGYISQNYVLVLVAVVLLVLFSGKGIFARARQGIEKALTDNWQLTLLASTGIALSLASGYTTFDGMRNFTSAPLLSVFISFGIQGVMLIVAWLIGESFATGMNQRTDDGRRLRLADATVGMLLGLVLVGIVFYWFLNQFNAVTVTSTGLRADLVKFADVSLYFLLALVLVGLIAFGSSRGGDISTPYVQSVRLIAKNAMLWVMFLASMGASVFFSFDSHFNAIFPAEQRKRAAEIRTTSQIGGAVSDIGALTQKRQIEEAERLFETDGWKAYDKQLTDLAQASQGAQGEIEKFFVQQMEERRRAINQQQERISTAQSGQAGLAVKKTSIAEELSRLKAERPGLAAEFAQHKSELDAKAKEIDDKRVEGMAEDRGVEGTLKQGKGPVYRQRITELATLQDQHKIKSERTKDAQKRLTTVESRIAQIERELSTIDGDLAKLKGEAQTAEQRIKTAAVMNADEEGAKLDPARVLPAFERARAAFRQLPDTERLAAVQQQCTNLLGAMASTQATKDKVRAVDCDPKQASEASARVFALNAGVAAYQANCAGGEKLARHTSTDALLAFGRMCLQDSGLITQDSADLGARLSSIDMNRDDKAHRFVVTWNAFLDGNRLAYLALILAIGVDALVFMSGLFGAQALRSPLSDVPSPKARSAAQLEAIIRTALGAERLENAELVLGAMRPSGERDYHAEIELVNYDSETARRIRKVMVAGASIGAVKRAAIDTYTERYLVRSELFEYLSVVSDLARESDHEYADRTRLIQLIGVALEPDQRGNADIVLHHIRPINQRHGFMAEVDLDAVWESDRKLVQTVLNAAMTLNAVQRHDRSAKRGLGARLAGRSVEQQTSYLIRADLFKTLLLYRAGSRAVLAGADSEKRLLGTDANGQEAYRPAIADNRAGLLFPHVHDGNGTAGAMDEELRAYFQERLMESLGLTLASLQRISAPEIAQQALAAADALKRKARSHRALSEQLRLQETATNQALEQAQAHLAAGYRDDEQALGILNELTIEIGARIPVLILLPEIGLINGLISALEEGVGDNRLGEDEDRLMQRLRGLRKELESMNWADQAAWGKVLRQIERLNEMGPVASNIVGDGTKLH